MFTSKGSEEGCVDLAGLMERITDQHLWWASYQEAGQYNNPPPPPSHPVMVQSTEAHSF